MSTAGPREDEARPEGDRIAVVTLIERGGKARSVKVENVTARTLRTILLKTPTPKAR